MKEISNYFVFFFVFVLFSCKREPEDSTKKEDEIRFRYYNLQERGWKSKSSSQQIDDINFSATEVPIQYYILKELGEDNLTKVDSIFEVNKRERVIEFVFEQEKEEDLLQQKFTSLDYQSSVEYMSFSIEKDFYAVTTSRDTIACSGVLFERNFKVGPNNKILLFFSNINPEDKIQLVYEDRLFQKGTIKFSLTDPPIKL